MTTTVANQRKGAGFEALIAQARAEGRAVDIDRRSKWGNPFPMRKESERDLACDQFEQYLMGRPDLLADVGQLRGMVLICWCAPKRGIGPDCWQVLQRMAEGERRAGGAV